MVEDGKERKDEESVHLLDIRGRQSNYAGWPCFQPHQIDATNTHYTNVDK